MARTPAVAPADMQLMLAQVEALYGLDHVQPERIRELVGDKSAGSQTTLSTACEKYRNWRQAQSAADGGTANSPLVNAARVRLEALAEQFLTEMSEITREQLETCKATIAGHEATIDALREELAARESQRAAAAERAETLTGDLTVANQATEAAEQQHTETERRRAETQEALEQEREARLTAERETTEEKAARERAETDAEYARAERDTAQTERSKTATALADERNRRETELAALREQHRSDLERMRSEHATTIERLEARAAALEERVDRIDAEKEAAEERADTAEKAAAQAAERERSAQARTETAEARAKEQAELAAARERERQEAFAELRGVREELARWQAEYRALVKRGESSDGQTTEAGDTSSTDDGYSGS